MKTVSEYCEAFERKVVRPDTSAAQRKALRRIFYAGFMSCLAAVVEAADQAGGDDELGAKLLQTLDEECRRFLMDELRDALEKARRSETPNDLQHVPQGQWKVARVDGTIEVHSGKPTIRDVMMAIRAHGLDTVNLRKPGSHTGVVMLVDDTGHDDGKPANPIATRLYWSQCMPGTTHPICGDVALVNDADFA